MFEKNKENEIKEIKQVKVSKKKKVIEKDNTWLDPEAEIVIKKGK